jgi:hypothetical protein
LRDQVGEGRCVVEVSEGVVEVLRRWDRGVQVDRDLLGGRAIEDRFEVRIVELDAWAVAVDHRSRKAVLADRSL